MQVLVGDIGGTKTGLALATIYGERISLSGERRYPSRDFATLGDLLDHYRTDTGTRCGAASLALAGPVAGGHCQATNLPWDIDAAALASQCGIGRVHLLNDLEAVAWGVDLLHGDDYAELQPGATDATGNACVVAAGTGLGQAGLYWDGARHRAFATEGGHTDFAATDDTEWALYAHLRDRFGRVSWERVVSGPGIGNIYDFLASRAGHVHPAPVAAALAAGDDPGAAIATAAAAGDPVCAETMTRFARLYGREAGNAALKHLATGGVWLGGGIAPKHLDLLRGPEFLAGFLNKGRMGELMARIPVRVILNEQTPLLGAARCLAEANLLNARGA